MACCASRTHEPGSVLANPSTRGLCSRKRQGGGAALCVPEAVLTHRCMPACISHRRRSLQLPLGSISFNAGPFWDAHHCTRLNHAALILHIRMNHHGNCGWRHLTIAMSSAVANGGMATGSARAAQSQGEVDFQRRASETSSITIYWPTRTEKDGLGDVQRYQKGYQVHRFKIPPSA